MKRMGKLSLAVMTIVFLVAVTGTACQYTCDFCGSYKLDTDPNQSILFQRDGGFQWLTLLAQASGNWYDDGDNITVISSWGNFSGKIEEQKFIDSGGSTWLQTAEDRSCILCCNVPRSIVKPTPTPTQKTISIDYFDLGNWTTSLPLRLAVASAEKMTQYREEGTINPPSDTFFVIVNVVEFNLGSSTVVTEANLFNLRDGSGHIYRPVKLSVLVSNQFPWDARTLARGEVVSGRILYIVPNQSSELSVVTIVNGQYFAWVLPW
jgi:hypothetical protein